MSSRTIRISEPLLEEDDITLVLEALRSGWLSGGPYVEKFEEEFAKYIGVKHAITVANGTMALIAALYAAGVRPGDEVIVPCFTFAATAAAVVALGAKPVFADIELETYNISVEDVEEKLTRRARAIIAVHLFGHMADMKRLKRLAEEENIVLIEDAAQAHGSSLEGVKAGAWGDAAAFSFYATKNMTMGEGGAVTTSNDEIAWRVRMLRNHGQESKYNHVTFGLNMRITSLQAALGLAQLRKLERMNEARRRNARMLSEGLRDTGLILPVEKPGYRHVYHQYVVRVDPERVDITRDELARRLRERGVETAVHYPRALPDQPFYRALGYPPAEKICPNAAIAAQQVLSLPVHPKLTHEDIRYVIRAVREALGMEG
ncbi:Glutamine--scyllo-inositol transaminase [Pyrolobus fumarii 1A]|uniref:Glutamine--scyllo-inositol transaminase n=1 Tax=Pyrolobus fumarii (strain DSM 11204 / 1A) TaxID=694429 RepID=G0EEH6_PYRF1|nr:DegT/DnrJ/EryC1/StrS family aminotransferase [Pyrolobus fumarii]AEM38017.1 Glutamine--scyllo-inositol transaminase [Pyrolobus fumarii 1A]